MTEKQKIMVVRIFVAAALLVALEFARDGCSALSMSSRTS